MSENEILVKGIVAGMAIVLPFLGITIARWHSWKRWCKFWQEQNKFAHSEKNQLFRDLKIEKGKREYFESKLKHIIETYKPLKETNK